MTNVVKSNISNKTIRVEKNPKVCNAGIRIFMDTSRFRFNQAPTETPNGVITVFTLPNSDTYVSGLIEVFLDGLQQIKTTDYSETTSSTITMVIAPATGEVLKFNYIKG